MYQELVKTRLRDSLLASEQGVKTRLLDIVGIFNREQMIGEANGLGRLEELVRQEAKQLMEKEDNGTNDTNESGTGSE